MTPEERVIQVQIDAKIEADRLEALYQEDLRLLETIKVAPVNVSMSISLTQAYKTYCVFNISDKMTIHGSHRKVAKILI